MPTDTDDNNLAVMRNDMSYMKRDIAEIKKTVLRNYVTQDQFEPIKRIVYGLVTIILAGVGGAGLNALLK